MKQKNKRKIKNFTIAVYVEGETEKWYLQKMKEHEKLNHITLEPLLATKTTLKKNYEKVIELSDKYDHVFWLIDMDTFLKENQEGASTLNNLNTYINKVKKKNSKITVIVNTPCFETWILLHFAYTTQKFNNCNTVQQKIIQSGYIPNYEKTEKYYKNPNGDIYIQLKKNLSKAIQHSERLGEYNPQNSDNTLSEMYKLFRFREVKIYPERDD